MTISEFRATLTDANPPAVSIPLQALWQDAQGEWHKAHDLLQDENGSAGSWVHAYLHRKEGDLSNAAYWYRKAGKPVATGTLDAEWDAITSALLATSG